MTGSSRAPQDPLRDVRRRIPPGAATSRSARAWWAMSWASSTRTVTPRSTTRWCAWCSPGHCATRWSPVRGTSDRPVTTLPPHPRYTECKMAPLAMEIVRDIEEEHRRLPGQLRRPHPGTVVHALPDPEPPGERFLRHRGRHGHEHPLAQPPEVADGCAWLLEHPEATPRSCSPRCWERSRDPTSPPVRRSSGRGVSRTPTAPGADRSRCVRWSRSRRSRTAPASS